MASRVPKINGNPKRINGPLYLKKAKKACLENNYSEAYENFVYYFESLNDPTEATTAVQSVFTSVVCKIGTILEETANTEELLKCYIQAINFFPNNYVILNNLGAYMFRIGEVDIARRYLERAVQVNKNYLPAEKNLLHVMWDQIPRWHFRMLNDKERNIAYEKALALTLDAGYKHIIDIGAGCGLLSLIASKDSEAVIHAYEENKSLYKVCNNILKQNKATNVNLVNCYSTDIKDPPEKCNLIVTEIFDVALFGERALETILHALLELRTEDDFRIIPSRATVYVTGICSEDLLKKNQVTSRRVLNLLDDDNLCIKQNDVEPYDAEYLPNKNVTVITNTQKIFDINFYDIDQISSLASDNNYQQITHLTCKEGIIHALAIWFDLNLNEEISVTTNPYSEKYSRCWEQAIFYLQHPISVKDNEVLTLNININDCKLSFNVDEDDTEHDCFKVSKEIITFLNDEKLVESIIAMAHKTEIVNMMVVDDNVFPLLGFLLARDKGCTVYHTLKNNCDKYFIQYLLSVNSIPKGHFIFLEDDEDRIGTNSHHKLDLYFFDAVNIDGSLEPTFLKRKHDVKCKIQIPSKINIKVELIYSLYLDYCNRVSDENVFHMKIAECINEYTGCEHPNLEKFDYHEYSESITYVLDGDGKNILPIVINKTGVINAILYWFELEMLDDITFSTHNSSHYKKSCFLLESPKSVLEGDILQLVFYVNNSYIKIYLE